MSTPGPKRGWRQQELALIRANLHLTNEQLAKLLNRTRSSVMSKKQECGLHYKYK